MSPNSFQCEVPTNLLISPRSLRRYWNLDPKTIVHVGGHLAEELPDYLDCGWGDTATIWVEAIPWHAAAIESLVRHAGAGSHSVLSFLAWNEDCDDVQFFVMSNSQSSSALPLGEHLREYPGIVVEQEIRVSARRLESALPPSLADIDLLSMDVQGSELKVLEGLGTRLDGVKALYLEVNLREMYQGAPLVHELDDWLSTRGFRRVDWQYTRAGWGDALYLRTPSFARTRFVRRTVRVVMEAPARQTPRALRLLKNPRRLVQRRR